MSRRKRSPIAIEDRSRELPSMRLGRAMEVLQQRDPQEYLRIVELAEAYAQLHSGKLETAAEFRARVARIRGGRGERAN